MTSDFAPHVLQECQVKRQANEEAWADAQSMELPVTVAGLWWRHQIATVSVRYSRPSVRR